MSISVPPDDDPGLSPFDEGLLELYSLWYSGVPPDLRIEARGGIDGSKMVKLWQTLWFAKPPIQAGVDATLRERFLPLLAQVDLSPGAATPTPPAFLSPMHAKVWTIGFIILCDQITRNVFRDSARAYSGDALARRLVESLVPAFDELPLPIRLSVILVYIHSEDTADLEVVHSLMERVKASKAFGNYSEVWPSLTGIA